MRIATEDLFACIVCFLIICCIDAAYNEHFERSSCRYGQKWDRLQQKCTKCDLGFYGNDCKKTCNYPFYGSNCVFECNCSKEECHFKNGCRDHHIEGEKNQNSLSKINTSFKNVKNDTRCDGVLGETCCAGYKWNPIIKNCTRCETGLFGLNCTLQCQKGTYGQDCQHICSCEIKDCDHVFGCFKPSTQRTKHRIYSRVTTIEKSLLKDKNDLHLKLNRMCDHSTTKPKITLMMTAVIVLAAVAFIISLLNLFFHRLIKRSKLISRHGTIRV